MTVLYFSHFSMRNVIADYLSIFFPPLPFFFVDPIAVPLKRIFSVNDLLKCALSFIQLRQFLIKILQEATESTGSVNAPRRVRSQVSQVSFPSDVDTVGTNSSSIDDPDLNEDDSPVLMVAL